MIDVEEITEKFCLGAKKSGAEADIFIENTNFAYVKSRLKKVEMLEISDKTSVNFRLIKDKRLISMSCNNPSELEGILKKALISVNYLPEDKNVQIAKSDNQINLLHGHKISDQEIDTLKNNSLACDKYGNEIDGITNSEGCVFQCNVKKVTARNTSGFFGQYDKKVFCASAEFIAGKDKGMNPGYESIMSHDLNLLDPISIAKSAANDAIRGLNSKKVSTCKADVLFESRCASSLIKSFANAVNASAVCQSSTFLLDALDKQVFPPDIQIIDDPLNNRGIRFGPFDGECIDKRKNNLVKDGVLKNWILDTYNGNKIGVDTNGMASRSSGGLVKPSYSSLYMQSSKNIKEEELIKSVKSGFYVTDVFGFGVNYATGNYSQGAKGIWIEDGKLSFAVSEVTISGNLKDMFKELVVADNLEFKSTVNCPTLFVGKMTISGN